jgi:hypothetical protein
MALLESFVTGAVAVGIWKIVVEPVVDYVEEKLDPEAAVLRSEFKLQEQKALLALKQHREEKSAAEKAAKEAKEAKKEAAKAPKLAVAASKA